MEDKIKHFANTITEFLTSAYGWGTMLCTLLITSDTTMLFSFLFSLIIIDYVTGIWATYIEYKNSGEKPEVYITKSKRLRESGTKIVGYLLILILAWFISKNIYTEKISLFGVIREFDVLQLALIISSGIEFWSNLENVKRAGFDVVGKFEGIVKRIWQLIRGVQGR